MAAQEVLVAWAAHTTAALAFLLALLAQGFQAMVAAQAHLMPHLLPTACLVETSRLGLAALAAAAALDQATAVAAVADILVAAVAVCLPALAATWRQAALVGVTPQTHILLLLQALRGMDRYWLKNFKGAA
jgi:hypothetical protein